MDKVNDKQISSELLETEREWFIQAPWGRLCIVAWGDCSDPPVLLCHGENDSLASFRPLLRLLPRNFYYVGMELPGNGKSDRFPQGLMISFYDMVYPIEVVRRHFRWHQFIYMAHSVATIIGRLYNLSYPDRMSQVIELDQISMHLGVPPEKFGDWYNRFFTNYFEKYQKYNSPKENAPTYTWDEAIDKVVKKRGLQRDRARATLERWTEPAGQGLIRFTIDQRLNKMMTPPPFSPSQVEKHYTTNKVATLGIVASESIERGLFKNAPFLLDEKAFKYNSYRVRKVEGTHDVHVIDPELLAPYVSAFLLQGLKGLDEGSKSKL